MTYALIQAVVVTVSKKVMDAFLELYINGRIKIQFMCVVLPLFKSLKHLSVANFYQDLSLVSTYVLSGSVIS